MTKPEPCDFAAAPPHCHGGKINNHNGPSRFAGDACDRVKKSDLGKKAIPKQTNFKNI